MARLPRATRDTIPADQVDVFDELTAPSGSAPATGPGSALMHVPRLRKLEKSLVNHVRFDSCLPARIIELATLVAARALDCPYVWSAHADRARKDGVRDATIAAIRSGLEPPDLSKDEQVAYDFGRDLFASHRVSEAVYEAAVGLFGTRGTVELSMVYGCYSMLAVVANTFEVDVPADKQDILPPNKSQQTESKETEQ